MYPDWSSTEKAMSIFEKLSVTKMQECPSVHRIMQLMSNMTYSCSSHIRNLIIRYARYAIKSAASFKHAATCYDM